MHRSLRSRSFWSNKKQPDGRILQLYADALKAHAAEAGSAPLMMWDLQRLEYLGESLYYTATKRNLFGNYIGQLNALLESYRDKPYSVEVASTLASRLWDTDRYDNARRALDLCNQWIAAYPEYRNINNLVNLRNTLTAREASIFLPSVAYPGESDSVQLSYRNIDSLTVRIYRQPEPLSIAEQNTYYITPQTCNRDECVYNHDYPLGDTLSLVTRQRSLVFPQLAPGLYAVEMLADGKEQQSICYYTVSGVKVITRPAADKQVELIAVDSRTGKPLSKAEVVLYQSKSYQGTDATEKARLRTDKNGLCLIDTEDEGFLFAQVSTPLDRFAPADRPLLTEAATTTATTAIPAPHSSPTARSTGRDRRSTSRASATSTRPSEQPHRSAASAARSRCSTPRRARWLRPRSVTDAYGQFTGSFVIPRGNLLGDYTLRVNQSWGDRLSDMR